MTTPIAAAPLDRRVGHQPRATEDGHCRRECPYMEAWSHPFWHQTAWCWKQMRDLAYYDGLIADCLHRTPDENLARLPVEMMPNVEVTGAERASPASGEAPLERWVSRRVTRTDF